MFLFGGIAGTMTQQWFIGGIHLVIALFLFATYSGVEIDTEKKRFREYNKWFGLFKIGKWKALHDYLGATLVSMNKVHRMYSRSNRVNSSSQKEFWIYLVNKTKRPAIAIKRCKTHKQGQISLDEFSIWLKLPVFSI